MKRVATAVILLAALVLGTVAVAGVSPEAVSTAPAAKSGKAATTTLTVWVGWSARELNEFKKVVAEYDRKNAAVQVKVVGGITDDKILAALRSGNAPDVVSSFTSANVGIYCPSGGWIDLGPYLKRDNIPTSSFPAATMYYTQYQGKRCALPLLADVYGFYYNKAMFQAAGLTRPPRTLSELTTYAKKLTKKKADGSLDVVGYNPFFGFYQNTDQRLSALDQRQVVRRKRKVQPQQGRRLVEPAPLAEEPRRLLRAQEPRQMERRRR